MFAHYMPEWLRANWSTPFTDRERLLLLWVVVANMPLLALIAKLMFGTWQKFRLAIRLNFLPFSERAHLPYDDQKLRGLFALFFILSLFALAAELEVLQVFLRH
jgi:hypothetical protein